MAKRVEPLMTGSLLLKVGEEILIRGTPSILFRFEMHDDPPEVLDEGPDVLVATILRNSSSGLPANWRYDTFELRYVALPRGTGDIFDVTYTLVDVAQV